jgi:hypothetical protein
LCLMCSSAVSGDAESRVALRIAEPVERDWRVCRSSTTAERERLEQEGVAAANRSDAGRGAGEGRSEAENANLQSQCEAAGGESAADVTQLRERQ